MAVRAAEAITTSVTTCFLSRCATSPAGLAGLRDKDAANVMQVGGPAYPGMRPAADLTLAVPLTGALVTCLMSRDPVHESVIWIPEDR